mmetsp:Transcript_9770/g.22424  ORF Transcript_9770/g.22424 Transcript_9770/m.22424 type:complete len:253 (+) Transcript_9770:548-1306(+)
MLMLLEATRVHVRTMGQGVLMPRLAALLLREVRAISVRGRPRVHLRTRVLGWHGLLGGRRCGGHMGSVVAGTEHRDAATERRLWHLLWRRGGRVRVGSSRRRHHGTWIRVCAAATCRGAAGGTVVALVISDKARSTDRRPPRRGEWVPLHLVGRVVEEHARAEPAWVVHPPLARVRRTNRREAVGEVGESWLVADGEVAEPYCAVVTVDLALLYANDLGITPVFSVGKLGVRVLQVLWQIKKLDTGRSLPVE